MVLRNLSRQKRQHRQEHSKHLARAGDGGTVATPSTVIVEPGRLLLNVLKEEPGQPEGATMEEQFKGEEYEDQKPFT